MCWAEGACAFQHKHISAKCLTSHSAGSCLVPTIPENDSGFSQQANGCRHTSHNCSALEQESSAIFRRYDDQTWSVSWQSRLDVLLVRTWWPASDCVTYLIAFLALTMLVLLNAVSFLSSQMAVTISSWNLWLRRSSDAHQLVMFETSCSALLMFMS